MRYLSTCATEAEVRLTIEFRATVYMISSDCPFSLYYVNLRRGTNRTDSSSKVEEIICQVISLYERDESVKIIIFSHWSNILKIIETALSQNQIKFRSQLNKFHMTINEFKVK